MDRDFDKAAPADGLPPAQAALWWLRKGGFAVGPEWQRAHAICQSHEGERAADLVHGLAHWIEGDLGNADYWYRRAGARRGTDFVTDWERLVTELPG